MILKGLEVGPLASNCYIVGSEATREGMIIDPGDEADTILRAVKVEKLDIKLIVVTHGHTDHIGALKEVKDATGAPFAMHPDDGRLLQARMARLFGSSGDADSNPEPDRLLKDGDFIDIGDLHFTVIHTPGHSPGGICILGHGILFSGDTLFQSSIGRADFPGSSYAQLLNSIHTKLMILPDETVVLPGHGPETTIGDERRWNPFLRGQG